MIGVDVQTRVALILSQSRGQISIRDGATVTTMAAAPVGKTLDATAVVREGPGGGDAESEQLDLLRVLYSSVPENLRDDFWKAVRDGLGFGPEAAQVIAHLVVELRRLDQFPAVDITLAQQGCHTYAWLWNGLRTKLSLQPNMFSDADVVNIHGHLSQAFEAVKPFWQRPGGAELQAELNAVLKTVLRIRYIRLKHELLSTENPELNTDRKELMNRVESLQFSPSIAAAIQQAERQIRTASTELEFRGCMDLLRVIFEEIFEESARRIEPKVGKPSPAGPSVKNFQPFKQYLENARLLNSNESEVMQKLYNYISQDGSHSLGAAPEQLRVTKNTVIEWLLMLVGRVQRFIA